VIGSLPNGGLVTFESATGRCGEHVIHVHLCPLFDHAHHRQQVSIIFWLTPVMTGDSQKAVREFGAQWFVPRVAGDGRSAAGARA
jgi:hypothetical protein